MEAILVGIVIYKSIQTGVPLLYPILYAVIYCITTTCALVAMIKEQRSFMWLVIIWKLIFIGLLLLCILLLTGCAIIYSEQITDRIPIARGNMLTFVCIIDGVMIVLAAFCIWQLLLIFKCMRHFLEKNLANVTPTLMYRNENTRGNQRVIQMQPPTQQSQQPDPQWTTQETQYQQPIVQQEFQEPFNPFDPPPVRTIWSDSPQGNIGSAFVQEKY
uniref:Uncharacterized protein n=1 Tax=Plectus sambesii TaxID=2011161 RepID=A0A914V8U7_9BILA